MQVYTVLWCKADIRSRYVNQLSVVRVEINTMNRKRSYNKVEGESLEAPPCGIVWYLWRRLVVLPHQSLPASPKWLKVVLPAGQWT